MIRAAVLFITILVSAQSACAQDRVLPSAYRALWAAPSCQAPAQVLVTSAHFALSAGPDSARIDPLAVRAHGDDYIKVEQGGESFFLALEKPDTMTVTALKIRNGIWPERLDPFNPALTVRTFEKCETPPAPWASLHPDGLAAFGALDRLLRSCAAPGMAGDCAVRMFDTADLNHDTLLDYREMAIAWRRMMYVAGAGGSCAFATLFPGTSAADGPAHAAQAVRAGDADSDYRLSFAEISAAPPALLPPVATQVRRLLPALPAGTGLCPRS